MERLKKEHPLPDLGSDPISAVQDMLQTKAIGGTQVVELSAEGRNAQFVADLVNEIVDAYRWHVVETYKDQASDAYSQLSGEVDALNKEVTARRQAVDTFRAQYDIVSMEPKRTIS